MKKLFLIPVVLVALVYAGDYLAAKFRLPNNRTVFLDMRVDQLYTATNRWNQVEWSHGDPVVERCVYSLFPHFGYSPCWYLTKHPIRITHTD